MPAAITAQEFFAAARPALDRAATALGGDRPLVSDLVDDAGHQYVDIVMEGGGVLGVSLLGYVYALEHFGIRFLGIGGTSAGSVTALMLAAAGEPREAKAGRLTDLLANMPMAEFIDGDQDACDFIKAVREGAGLMKLVLKGAQVIDNLNEDLGLCPGKVFHDWARSSLDGLGVSSWAALRTRMAATPPGLRRLADPSLGTVAAPYPLAPRDDALCLIAADLTTEAKVAFPRMARLYWDEPDRVHPADFARASMSIPFVFAPFEVAPLPDSAALRKAWCDETACTDRDVNVGPWPPARCLLVDGGVMSNFPIDAFHRFNAIPRCPTFGVKIQYDEHNVAIDGPKKLASQLFGAARHCLDYDFILRNPDFRQLVAYVDTGDANWLNFDLAPAEKKDLFVRGVEAAGAFLKRFDWPAYKRTRKAIAEAYVAAAKSEGGT